MFLAISFHSLYLKQINQTLLSTIFYSFHVHIETKIQCICDGYYLENIVYFYCGLNALLKIDTNT